MRTRVLATSMIATAAVTAVAIVLVLRQTASDPSPRPRTTIAQALAEFVHERFGARYIGPCPRTFPPDGEIPGGMCAGRFLATADGAVYGIGSPFSEWGGEATLVRDPSGSWRVESYEEYPSLGAD